MTGLLQALRDSSLRRKVTLTLALVFAASVARCWSRSCRCSASSGSACSTRTSGCSRRCAATTSATFIYDQLFRNRESLAVHLADLAGQEGILWARVEAARARPRRDRRPRHHPPAHRRRVAAVPRPARRRAAGRGGRRGRPRRARGPAAAGRPAACGARRCAPRARGRPGQDEFREAIVRRPDACSRSAPTMQAARRHVRPAAHPEEPRARSSAARAHHAAAVLRRRHAVVRARAAAAEPAALAHGAGAGAARERGAGARRDRATSRRACPCTRGTRSGASRSRSTAWSASWRRAGARSRATAATSRRWSRRARRAARLAGDAARAQEPPLDRDRERGHRRRVARRAGPDRDLQRARRARSSGSPGAHVQGRTLEAGAGQRSAAHGCSRWWRPCAPGASPASEAQVAVRAAAGPAHAVRRRLRAARRGPAARSGPWWSSTT